MALLISSSSLFFLPLLESSCCSSVQTPSSSSSSSLGAGVLFMIASCRIFCAASVELSLNDKYVKHSAATASRLLWSCLHLACLFNSNSALPFSISLVYFPLDLWHDMDPLEGVGGADDGRCHFLCLPHRIGSLLTRWPVPTSSCPWPTGSFLSLVQHYWWLPCSSILSLTEVNNRSSQSITQGDFYK